MWSLILRVRPSSKGWCRHATSFHRDVQVRVHSCFPLGRDEFLEDVSFEGPSWREAYQRSRSAPNVQDATLLQDGDDQGRVRFRVRSCPVVQGLREAGALPRFPFRVVNGHGYLVFVTPQPEAQKVMAALQTTQLSTDVVYSGPYQAPKGLTPRQTEVLARAIAEGYYDYPRRITLTRLAKLLDVAGATLSEALVMVEREVVHRYVEVAGASHVPEFSPAWTGLTRGPKPPGRA